MDLETIQNKSIDDLKIIASMLGIEVPERCTKAKLISLIVGDADNGGAPSESSSVKEANDPAPDVKAVDASKAAPAGKRTRGRPPKKAAAPKEETQVSDAQAPAASEPAEKPKKAESTRGRKTGKGEKSEKADKPDKAEKAEQTEKTEKSEKAEKIENAEAPAAPEKAEKAEKTAKTGAAQKTSSKRGRPPKSKKAETVEDKEAKPSDAGAAETSGNEANVRHPAEEQPAREEDLTGTKKPEFSENSEEVTGLLDVMQEGYGFLRVNKYFNGNKDVFVAPNFIRKYGLRTGDELSGRSRPQRDNDKYQALFYITAINGKTPEQAQSRVPFESLIPIYPDEQLKLETSQNELSTRLIDLIAPIGKGQRGMIVSPPKAGKTVLLKKIANAITANYPEVKLIVLLIDERPEEVTDMRESIEGEVVSSTFDEMPERHIKVAEMVFERARRLVEFGYDVVILMDSLTRLARAYNITITPTGRSLSGGLDPGAMYNPKKFFGAARNIRGGGSLTIVATALIDTGSKMDDVIFEEFKGTGNMELHLDRKLSEKRVFPAIDINKSGTRKEELLLSEAALNAVFSIRKAIANAGGADVTEMIVSKMLKTQNNEEFIKSVRVGIERPSN
ncbi:MAG: transcription termination factor Rho [Clostridia bacterium]|nr:transcription termination factor Rho [Clostridia bacterium]